MATPEQLHTWAEENRAWARETHNRALAAALCRLAKELDGLAAELDAAGVPVAFKLPCLWANAERRPTRWSGDPALSAPRGGLYGGIILTMNAGTQPQATQDQRPCHGRVYLGPGTARSDLNAMNGSHRRQARHRPGNALDFSTASRKH